MMTLGSSFVRHFSLKLYRGPIALKNKNKWKNMKKITVSELAKIALLTESKAGCANDVLCSAWDFTKGSDRKVSVIGTGRVGSACVAAILNRNLASEICLIDKNEKKVMGEAYDLGDAAHLCSNTVICGGTDYKETQGSKIIVIAASEKPPNSHEINLPKQIEICKEIVSNIIKYNHNPIFIVATRPYAILSQVAWKASNLPKNHVFGVGTMIDTERLKTVIWKMLFTRQRDIVGWVLGEHGENSIPIWSSFGIQGLRLRDVFPNMRKCDVWNKSHEHAACRSSEIDELKRHDYWSTANCVATLVSDVLNNTGSIRPVSTLASNYVNRPEEFFLSLPCVITRAGVSSVLKIRLEPEEEKSLCGLAAKMIAKSKNLQLGKKDPSNSKSESEPCKL